MSCTKGLDKKHIAPKTRTQKLKGKFTKCHMGYLLCAPHIRASSSHILGDGPKTLSFQPMRDHPFYGSTKQSWEFCEQSWNYIPCIDGGICSEYI